MGHFIPRQIILPIRNISGAENRSSVEMKFVEGLSAFLDNRRQVIPLGRARAGIYLLVKQFVSAHRRHVIMSPYTIPDVVNMVTLAGGVPIFVDFERDSTNVSTDSVDRALDDRIAAVMLTHYHVNQNNMSDIAALCKSKSIPLFDDCAISFGSDYDGAPIGTHTDASVMSLSAFKLVNFLWGGALSVASADLFAAAEAEIRQWPRLKLYQYRRQAIKTLSYSLVTSATLFPLFFALRRPYVIGKAIKDVFPVSRIETTHLDATIRSRPHLSAIAEWSEKLGSLRGRVNRRRSIAKIYDTYFRKRSVSAETSDARRAESCFINYPIVVGTSGRDVIYREMLRAGFDVGLSLYPNVHEVDTFKGIEGTSTNVSALVRSVLTLPTHPRIQEDYAHELARKLADLVSAQDG